MKHPAGLQVHGVGHRFGLAEVLHDINLSLAPGETLALIGPSGCGKSTLLQVVAGLLLPSEGTVTNGFQRVGCMFQQPRLLPWKSALDNIALGLKARGDRRSGRRQQAAAMAQWLGLAADDMAKFPHALSGGMQSRVALGRALVLAPDLLLLDEPFSALDVGLKMELYGLLRSRVAEHRSAVLMITHDLMEAVRLADRVAMMAPDPGRLVREFALSVPQARRTEAWIYQTAGELVQTEEVRLGFGLVGNASSPAPARVACGGIQ